MVIDKAKELGLAISESDEFTALINARIAMEKDAALVAGIDEYNAAQQEIGELMERDDELSARLALERSQALERIRGELMEHPLFNALIDAQNDFQRLMNQVNATIGAYLGMDATDDDCTHDCGTCGGCKH